MRLLPALLSLVLAAGAAAAPQPGAADQAGRAAPVEAPLQVELGAVTLQELEVIRLLVEAAGVIGVLHQRQLEAPGFYPADMSRAEFEAWDDPGAASPHTVVRRDHEGGLMALPYHQAWPVELGHAARLLARAAELTGDERLRHYLTLRARALIVGDYPRAEDAWLALQDSSVDVLIGPLGTDEDDRFGLKASFGAYVLLRDWGWGARLARFTVFLPELQRALPVSPAFKDEVPEVRMKLAVYDLVYHAGYGELRGGVLDAHAVDDRQQRQPRAPGRLQLRNVMHARFDALVRPVAALMLEPEQQRQVGFEAFFLNAMLHEMAHELGLHRTVSGGASVAEALGEHAALIEEAKAAVLSLWMVEQLHARGELPDSEPAEHYASFLAGIFRAIQLDADSPGARAQLLLFNHFRDWGAFRRDPASGRYRVSAVDMPRAVESLAVQLLTLQGSGDRAGAAALVATMGMPRDELRADLQRLDAAGIPTAVVFSQRDPPPGL